MRGEKRTETYGTETYGTISTSWQRKLAENFTGKFPQILKGEIKPTVHTASWKGNTLQLILWVQHSSEANTRQGYYNKKTEWTHISHEHRCKNPQQNIGE